jgi:hypothetical protein
MGKPKPSLPSDIPVGSPAASQATHVRYLVLAGGCSMALIAYLPRLGFGVFAPEVK